MKKWRSFVLHLKFGHINVRYHLPDYPVLIALLSPSPGTTIPTQYRSQFMGLHAQRDYRVIKLWEVDSQIAFQPELNASSQQIIFQTPRNDFRFAISGHDIQFPLCQHKIRRLTGVKKPRPNRHAVRLTQKDLKPLVLSEGRIPN